jgi:hypothetical protein
VVSVRALDAHAGLVAGDDLSPAQDRDGHVTTGTEPALRAPEQVHQPALAERQAEQVGERRLQPFVGERLKGLQIRRHRMQPRTEGRTARGGRHWCHDPLPAARAPDREPAVLRHDRRHLRQLDLLARADDPRRKSDVQAAAAARASLRTMLHDRIGIVAQHPAVTLVTGLGAAGL